MGEPQTYSASRGCLEKQREAGLCCFCSISEPTLVRIPQPETQTPTFPLASIPLKISPEERHLHHTSKHRDQHLEGNLCRRFNTEQKL